MPDQPQTQTQAQTQVQAQPQPQAERFKAEMPQIPGVGSTARPPGSTANPAIKLVAGLFVVIIVVVAASRMLMHPKQATVPAPATPAQIEVPAPSAPVAPAIPRATKANPEIATVAEMSKPWTSKDFVFVNDLTGETVNAELIRLSSGSASQSDGYWAFAMNAPFGNCQFEYVTDLPKLANDYDFHNAKHPMVGNPCSRTVFDPLKMTSIPGNIWVRGGISQGSDLRPPLGIQVQVQNKNILALRME